MVTNRESITAISRLIGDTQDGRIHWTASSLSLGPADADNKAVETAYRADYKGRRLCIYRLKYKVEQPRGIASMLTPREFITRDYPYWDSTVVLQIIDDKGKALWTFPATNGLEDLLSAVEYHTAGVRDFLDDLTDDYADEIEEPKRDFEEAQEGSEAHLAAGERLIRAIDARLDVLEEGTPPTYSSDEWREVHETRTKEEKDKLVSLRSDVMASLRFDETSFREICREATRRAELSDSPGFGFELLALVREKLGEQDPRDLSSHMHDPHPDTTFVRKACRLVENRRTTAFSCTAVINDVLKEVAG